MTTSPPPHKPQRPYFSSGPCAKRPGWSLNALNHALLSRSHRSNDGKKRLKEIIDLHRVTLGIPDDYQIGIVPASDTGAVEMSLWSMLGPCGVDVLAFDTFSNEWARDITEHLKIADTRVFAAPFGGLPDPAQISGDRDLVFVWNGTTSGVVIPNGNFIAGNRTGITICDATSAVFAYDLPWQKLDVTTWSWQKVIGGEAAHGMIVLSPRAVERLKTYTPAWPLPKIFRLVQKGELIHGIFAGETINTPSMMAVEDARDALIWVQSVGGWQGTRDRCLKNAAALRDWVKRTDYVDELAVDPEARSITSVCLKFVDPWFLGLSADAQAKFVKDMTGCLESQGVAYDIAAYRDAPPGLRIWCGATVEESDLRALTPWIDWAYQEVKRG